MDEENFDVENNRLQIKKLKEKVKCLVSEVDLPREITSDDFPKLPKLQFERNIGDNTSELESVREDSEEFLDINEAAFMNEENWLSDWNSNCNQSGQPSDDIFKTLYSEVEEFDADMSDLYRELRLLQNSTSSFESKGSSHGKAFIDSRTFTRPKKYISRPPLMSIVSNSGDEGVGANLQRRLTTSILPTKSMINKLEDLNRVNNRAVLGVYGESNWEEGSQEGLADIENSSKKSQGKSLPASIIDRLQELKRSNNSYIGSRTPETGRHLNVVNGNVDNSDKMNVAEDANKVKAAFDLYVKNALSTPGVSDIMKNIPDYLSDNDNESFFSLDEVSGFCDRLTLSIDSSTYSSIVREMEQNEIRFYHGANCPEITSPRRLTFGGMEIPMNNDSNRGDFGSPQHELLEISDPLNQRNKVNIESAPHGNSTFEVKNKENHSESRYETEKKHSLVDVILQSDIIKSLTPNCNNKYCDNRNGSRSNGDRITNSASNNFNETITQNDINKLHSEKYTTKIFDATFKKSTPSERSNGRKDSDHSEDDCMSTASDNSNRSIDSNSELKNIEELKNIALQQNKKLTDVKFSTPSVQTTEAPVKMNVDEWQDISPIRRVAVDGEPQGSSGASSRGQSPSRGFLPPTHDGMRKARPFSLRQPPKVPQRELKLKPTLIRPTQNFKKPVNNGRTSSESVTEPKRDCKTSASVAGIPVVKQCVTAVTGVSSTTNTRPVTRIPSGIPRPPSRLKQPQIRVSTAYKK